MDGKSIKKDHDSLVESRGYSLGRMLKAIEAFVVSDQFQLIRKAS